MKKLFSLLLTLLLAAALCGCSEPAATSSAPAESITLNFIITNVDEDTELFNGPVTIDTTAETLADFLAAQDEFEVVLEEGDYGTMITSMCGNAQDMDNGPWWVYDSDNNTQCTDAGFCDASSSLKIADGDNFTFDLTSSFE